MKKVILCNILLLLTIGCFAQQQPKISDTMHTASPVPVYAIILDSVAREQLFGIIQQADLKPSEIRGIITYLQGRSQLLTGTPPAAAVSTQRQGKPSNEALKPKQR